MSRFENNRARLLAVLAQQYRLRSVLGFEGLFMRRYYRQMDEALSDNDLIAYIGEFVG